MNAIVYHRQSDQQVDDPAAQMVYRDAAGGPRSSQSPGARAIVLTAASPPLVLQSPMPHGITGLFLWDQHLLRQTSHSSLVTSSVMKHRTEGHTFHSDTCHQRPFRDTKAWLWSCFDGLLLHAENFIWIAMCSVKKGAEDWQTKEGSLAREYGERGG